MSETRAWDLSVSVVCTLWPTWDTSACTSRRCCLSKSKVFEWWLASVFGCHPQGSEIGLHYSQTFSPANRDFGETDSLQADCASGQGRAIRTFLCAFPESADRGPHLPPEEEIS